MADGQNLISKYLKEFSLGGCAGGILSGTFLFTSPGSWTGLIWEWGVRLFFTSLIALCSGLASAWARDIYENYKTYKKQKQKEHEKRKRTNKNGRAA